MRPPEDDRDEHERELTAALAGDRRAFVRLVQGCERELRCFIAARAAPLQDVDEILQTSWIRAWEHLARHDRRASFSAWLKGIARHVLQEESRRLRRESTGLPERLQLLLAHGQAGGELLAAQEDEAALATALDACLAELGAEARELIQERYGADRGLTELAAGRQRSRAAVAGVLRRARAALARCLRGKGVLP
ncbi:MAG: sigma-70 family RNA polymerase sigma factor [Planctomycetota bacterium]